MKHPKGRSRLAQVVIVALIGVGVVVGQGIAKAQGGAGSATPTAPIRPFHADEGLTTASAIEFSPGTPSDVQLLNPGFEGEWAYKPCDVYNAYGQYVYSAPFGEIFVPDGWTAFFRHGPPVAHDPDNSVGWAQPEVHVINKEPPFLDPPRIQAGQRALKLFTFWKIHDAGLYQQVQVPPDIRWRLSGWVHTWTSQQDDPYQSTGDPIQAWLMVGLDPTGDTNPYAPTVVWSEPAHIYDDYARTPAAEVTSQGSGLTVFIRSWMLWPYKHNDVYWDAITLQPIYTGPPLVLTAEPALRTAHQGQVVTYTVALSTTPELALPLTLSASAIPGAASTFLPAVVQPGDTATLVMTPSLSTPAGTYPTPVTGSGAIEVGSVQIPVTTTTQVSLTVLPADFTLHVTPTLVTAIQGETASYLVGLASATPGFAFPVTLDVAGVPAHALSDITPSAVTLGTLGTQATLLITTAQKTPVSSYELIITGTAGELERTAVATLEVWARVFLPLVLRR